jgi:N6-adenosine-specific RNA methylase IME4
MAGIIVTDNSHDLQIVSAGGSLAIPGKITPTSLELPDDLPYDRWLSLGETLKRMEKSVQWWIGDWLRFGERRYGEMYSQALEATDYSYQALNDMKWVANAVEPSLRQENLSWSHHKEIAALPTEQAQELLEKAETDRLSVRELRSEVREAKQAVNREKRLDEIALNSVGKYTVIYADPPWKYDFAETDNRAIENHYPTMELEEICDLPVKQIAYDDSVLFLWATSPKLQEAFAVLNAWGFEYRTSLVWVKDKIGMGYLARGQHEILLIAKRGALPAPEASARPASVVHAPRTSHSTKPVEFYEIIERMYPGMTKVELFSRAYRVGWTAWGLEAPAA